MFVREYYYYLLAPRSPEPVQAYTSLSHSCLDGTNASISDLVALGTNPTRRVGPLIRFDGEGSHWGSGGAAFLSSA